MFAGCIMGKFIYFDVNVSTVLHSYILTDGNQQNLYNVMCVYMCPLKDRCFP